MEVADALDDADFDFIAGLQFIGVVSDQLFISGWPLGGEQDQAIELRHVDDLGSGTVFESVEADVHFSDFGLRARAFFRIFAIGFGASGLFLFVGQFFWHVENSL